MYRVSGYQKKPRLIELAAQKLAIWLRNRQARPGGTDTLALWRSFQGMNFTEWISLYQIINFLMDCIWLYVISSGISLIMSSNIYTL